MIIFFFQILVYSAWKLGYVGRIGSLGKLLDELMQVSKEEIIQKLEYVKDAQYLYTYKGVMEEIDYFIRESDMHNHTSRGSHLRCSPYQYNVISSLRWRLFYFLKLDQIQTDLYINDFHIFHGHQAKVE